MYMQKHYYIFTFSDIFRTLKIKKFFLENSTLNFLDFFIFFTYILSVYLIYIYIYIYIYLIYIFYTHNKTCMQNNKISQ